MLRGVRGATTVEKNDKEHILLRVKELLKIIAAENEIDTEDIAAVIFSSTADLNAAFPAKAAREIGWDQVPLFGTQEIDNPEGVPLCIRALLLINTEKSQKEINHIYLHGSAILRQDIVK